jgi:hypothetical protein
LLIKFQPQKAINGAKKKSLSDKFWNLDDKPLHRPAQSGAKATALQTLRDISTVTNDAKRLDCVRFTAAFARQRNLTILRQRGLQPML